MKKDIAPHFAVGETFEFDGHKLKAVECDFDECRDCFFHTHKNEYGPGLCLDNFDIHGFCAGSDIGRVKSLKFVEVDE